MTALYDCRHQAWYGFMQPWWYARSICELSMHARVCNVYVRSLYFRRKEIKKSMSSASKRDLERHLTADDLHYSSFCDTDVLRAKKATNLTSVARANYGYVEDSVEAISWVISSLLNQMIAMHHSLLRRSQIKKKVGYCNFGVIFQIQKLHNENNRIRSRGVAQPACWHNPIGYFSLSKCFLTTVKFATVIPIDSEYKNIVPPMNSNTTRNCQTARQRCYG